MKKLFITDILLVVSLVALCFGAFKISNLENENRVLKKEILKQKSTINQLETEFSVFEDILQEREMEVRFWGMKYDSIKEIHE